MYYSLAHLPRRMFVGPNKKTTEMRACQIFLNLSIRKKKRKRRGSMEAMIIHVETRQL
jgi:hypothetical protein